MADFTQNGGNPFTSSSSSSSDSTDMDMDMDMSSMNMSDFHTSFMDSLYSTTWTPKTKGEYAGTVIFLTVLAFIFRFLTAWHDVLQRDLRNRAAKHTVVVATSPTANSSQASSIDNPKEAAVQTQTQTNETQGDSKKGGFFQAWSSHPWRWSAELPLACLSTVTFGVGYLLMLAVMTMNVGYFMAVLGGIFAGSLAWQRYIVGVGGH